MARFLCITTAFLCLHNVEAAADQFRSRLNSNLPPFLSVTVQPPPIPDAPFMHSKASDAGAPIELVADVVLPPIDAVTGNAGQETVREFEASSETVLNPSPIPKLNYVPEFMDDQVVSSYSPAAVSAQPLCPPQRFRSLCDELYRNYTFRSGVVFMKRAQPDSNRLFYNPADLRQSINSNQFDFGVETGFEVGMTAHRAIGDLDFDFKYMSVGDWDRGSNRGLTGSVTRINMQAPISLSGPRSVIARYSSGIRSFEANFRYRYGAACSWTTMIMGFRCLSLDETLTGRLRAPGINPAEELLTVTTDNRLYGFQVGMDRSLAGDCCYCVQGFWRAGIYGNDSDSRVNLRTNGTGIQSFSARGSDNDAAFVGEMGIKAKVCLTDCLNFHGRYQILAVDGVALAGDQPSSANLATGRGYKQNGAFFHGAVFGLECTY